MVKLRRRRWNVRRAVAVRAAVYSAEVLEKRLLLDGVIYVDGNSPAELPNGTSWLSAYKDLQDALASAGPGTTIEVAQGTYLPTQTPNRFASFELKDGVKIQGGF